MKLLQIAILATTLLGVTSCAHHGKKCCSKDSKSCEMKDKSCCKDKKSCDMKKKEEKKS